MSLFIEGPELAGKTTLARAIGWPIIKVSNAERHNADSCYDDSMTVSGGDFIWDRWWPTEFIMGALQQRTPLSDVQMWQMVLKSGVMGGVLLWLLPTEQTIRERYAVRGDAKWNLDSCLAIRKTYQLTALHLHKWLTCTYILQDALILHRKLQERREKYLELNLHSWGYLGEKPTLLVGDNGEQEYPFFTKTGRGCGNYLFSALTGSSVEPNKVHIINSIGRDGKYPNWGKVLEFFNGARVIAMGSEASERLRIAQVWHESIPHPSYWKRFKNDNMQGYINRINKAYNDSQKHIRTTGPNVS